jgi:acyl transferase domain-containing protein
MGRELYESESTFRDEVNRCCELLIPHLGFDLRKVLYPEKGREEEAMQRLQQTSVTQPALFVIEFALARLWIMWGIKPEAMIGHSIGEYVAACLAGVFSLEDALAIVAERGRLMQNMPSGAMLAVPMPEDELRKILPRNLSLSAVNGPSLCVVSGPTAEVEAFLAALTASGNAGTMLHTSHAFHSEMMDSVLEPFVKCIGSVKRNEPTMPFISNSTGAWISAADATNPEYWAKHLRHTVRFADGVSNLLKEPDRVLLEVGPGTTLCSLARQQLKQPAHHTPVFSMRHPQEQQSDVACLLTTLGRLWLSGQEVDWSGFYAHELRRRIPLPTYPFEGERYWIDAKQGGSAKLTPHLSPGKNPDVADWFYVPSWKRSAPRQPIYTAAQRENWLVFLDDCGLGSSIAEKLEQNSQEVIKVRAGMNFESTSDGNYVVDPSHRGDYDRMKKLPTFGVSLRIFQQRNRKSSLSNDIKTRALIASYFLRRPSTGMALTTS